MEDDLNFRVVACEFLGGNDWKTRVWFCSTQLVVVDQGCVRPTFHFETETFGCWYQESRLRLLLWSQKLRLRLTFVSRIETDTFGCWYQESRLRLFTIKKRKTETFYDGLKSWDWDSLLSRELRLILRLWTGGLKDWDRDWDHSSLSLSLETKVSLRSVVGIRKEREGGGQLMYQEVGQSLGI